MNDVVKEHTRRKPFFGTADIVTEKSDQKIRPDKQDRQQHIMDHIPIKTMIDFHNETSV